jgi:MoxR-like ATPase
MSVTVEEFRSSLQRVRTEVGKVVVGQEEVVDLLLAAFFGSGHLLLEGVPGLGKTVLVRTVAQALGMSFGRIQFTPDLMPSDVTGTAILVDAPDGSRSFRFAPGPVFANLVLADEVNRATPKTQSALLEAMQEGQVTVLGQSHPLPKPFAVLATQNPVEMEGTYPLPEAQLDRFMFKVNVGFPDEDDLVAILDRTTQAGDAGPGTAMTAEQATAFRDLVRSVPAAEFAVRLASRLVLATHPEAAGAPEAVRKYVRFGVSPRAGQAMLMGAKFTALVAGRTHVAREDVVAVARPAMRHRIVLNFEAAAERVSADDVVDAAVKSVV